MKSGYLLLEQSPKERLYDEMDLISDRVALISLMRLRDKRSTTNDNRYMLMDKISYFCIRAEVRMTEVGIPKIVKVPSISPTAQLATRYRGPF